MVEAGRIVGGHVDNNGSHGYLLVRSKFETVNCPDATGGVFLSGLDPIGRMTGEMTTADGHQHGLLVQDGQCTAFDFPGSTSTYANGINSRGDIVGRYTDTAGDTHGFVVERFIGGWPI